MAICSGTSLLKAGLLLAVASVALWVSARDSRVPDTLPPIPAEELGVLDVHDASPGAEICSLAVSPDGRLLATGSRDGVVRLWEAPHRLLTRWQAHDEAVTALAYFPDSRGLLTAGADSSIRRWSVEESEPRSAGRWSSAAVVTAMAIAPDGRTVAIASPGRLGLHEAEHGAPLPGSDLAVPEAPLRALAFAPDGRALAGGGGGDNAVRVWELSSGSPVLRHTLVGHADNWVRGLAYTADGRTLVSFDTGGLVLAWDRAGNRRGQTNTGEPPCPHAAVGAGGRLVLTAAGRQGAARLWRLPDGWRH